jgi:hypothetical protein
MAGIAGGLMGVVRLSAIVIALGAIDTATVDGTTYFEMYSYDDYPYFEVWRLSFLAWTACGVAWTVFGWWTGARRESAAAGIGMNRWWFPFLWLMLTPIITMPLQIALFESVVEPYSGSDVGLRSDPPGEVEGWCPEGDDPYGSCVPNFSSTSYEYYEVGPMLLAFLPWGLVNLVPFAWALSKTRRIRKAGLVAGIMGVVRFLAPVLALAAFARATAGDGTMYFRAEVGLFSLEPFISVWGTSFLAWLASFVAWVLYGVLTSERRRATPTPTGPTAEDQKTAAALLKTSRLV